MFQKIIIFAPTSVSKKYCFEAWLDAACSLHYPNYEIFLADNSLDGGAYTKWMQDTFHFKYGQNNTKFKAIHSKVEGIKSVIDRMVISTEDCRKHVISSGATHGLSLETDIFAPPNIIEELLCQNKQVIGALYDRDDGRGRKLMIQKKVELSPRFARTENLAVSDEIRFVDGKVKEVAHVGLGAVLIRRDVLEKFDFARDAVDPNHHSDTAWAIRVAKSGIKIFSATNLYADHFNRSWGLFNVDFH